MEKIFNPALETKLAAEMEGNVYEHIYLLQFGKTYWLNKDLYAVIKGQVISIGEGVTQRASGDTLFNTHIECQLVGKYEPFKAYKRERREFTYKQINHFFKKKNNGQ